MRENSITRMKEIFTDDIAPLVSSKKQLQEMVTCVAYIVPLSLVTVLHVHTSSRSIHIDFDEATIFPLIKTNAYMSVIPLTIEL